MDGWKMEISVGVLAYFQGQAVSFREGNNPFKRPYIFFGWGWHCLDSHEWCCWLLISHLSLPVGYFKMWNSSPPINVICTNRPGIRACDSLSAPASAGWFYLTSQWASNKKVGAIHDPRRAHTSCQIVGYHWNGRRQWQDSGLGFQWWRQFPLQISRLSFFLIYAYQPIWAELGEKPAVEVVISMKGGGENQCEEGSSR